MKTAQLTPVILCINQIRKEPYLIYRILCTGQKIVFTEIDSKEHNFHNK